MRPWPRRADRLIGRSVLAAICLAWGVLLAFDVVVAFAAELADIGEGDYDAGSALLYVLYTAPRRAYELFPTSAVIGCLLGLGGLAANSELTALRAVGISRLRIALAAGGAVALLLVAMVGIGETLGPAGEQRAQALLVGAQSKDIGLSKWSGLWAREGDTFLNARSGRIRGGGADSYVELDRVRLYEFDPQGRLAAMALAARAEHRDQRWTLFDVRRSRFAEHSVETSRHAEEAWASQLQPDVLSLSIRRARYLSTADLKENLDYLRRNDLDTSEFESAYWGRVFYPLNVLALCLLAMPFAFGTLRSGGFGKRLFIGIVFGLGFFLLQRLTVNMAEVYRVDLRLAHGLPSALLLTYAFWWLRRKDV
ncbi:MAG: LPS export ABC transporter permease LptG [Lysobacteraceae bacterium]